MMLKSQCAQLCTCIPACIRPRMPIFPESCALSGLDCFATSCRHTVPARMLCCLCKLAISTFLVCTAVASFPSRWTFRHCWFIVPVLCRSATGEGAEVNGTVSLKETKPPEGRGTFHSFFNIQRSSLCPCSLCHAVLPCVKSSKDARVCPKQIALAPKRVPEGAAPSSLLALSGHGASILRASLVFGQWRIDLYRIGLSGLSTHRHTHTQIHTHTHTDTHTHRYIHTLTQTHTHRYIHTHRHTHTHTDTYTHTQTHTHTQIHTHTHRHTHTDTYTHTDTHTHTDTYTHTDTHTHIYIYISHTQVYTFLWIRTQALECQPGYVLSESDECSPLGCEVGLEGACASCRPQESGGMTHLCVCVWGGGGGGGNIVCVCVAQRFGAISDTGDVSALFRKRPVSD